MTKYLVRTSQVLLLLFIIAVAVTYGLLSLSLPKLNGTISAPVLAGITVTRDAQGVAQIKAKSREDASYALGYLHGQERFFQMDLLRRNSAGELAELFGQLAVNHDSKIKQHQFRKRVGRYVKTLSDSHQKILDKYTLGVNDGLSALTTHPFEYTLLSATPKAWLPEDSLLALYSMYMDLQDEYGDREVTIGALSELLTPDLFAFLTPEGSIWDAAIDGSEYFPPPIPNSNFAAFTQSKTAKLEQDFNLFPNPKEGFKGSNNWAVSGQLSATGSAIVADDMHLNIGVPNIWYRASIRFQTNGQEVKLDGVSLPGTPAIVVGSNHNVAWGFTNSYGDWSDLIKLQLNEDKTQYLTPDGFKPLLVETEIINIKDSEPLQIQVQLTQWGPVIGEDHQGNLLVMRWVAHDQEGINFNLVNMELAKDVEQALAVAHSAGIPAQNLVVGDKHGNIAWTIAGPIPRKFGLKNTGRDGWAKPQDWSHGNHGWSGYLESSEYPVVINPKSNRLWTGNSRVVGADMYQTIGDGGYALGARSKQIRDNLFAKEAFTEQDLLDIQNDDSAIFLSRWQEYLVNQVFTDSFVQNAGLSRAKHLVENWQARASVDSVGYLFVRQFRLNLRSKLFTPVAELLKQHRTESTLPLTFRAIRSQAEIPMWQLLETQPAHLIPEGYDSWLSFAQQVAQQTHSQLVNKYGSIDSATWGAHNTTKIQHPLSRAVPALSWLLDMPSEPVNGDTYMPRVQGKRFGSSQRMVISPGYEQHAIFHMPSSQSGHPLSPYYGKGHDDWVKGAASELLPGKTKYKLEFLPK